MVWQLRRATAADLDSIMAIETTVFRHDAWSPEMMRAELAFADSYYLVAFNPATPEQIDAYAGLRCLAGSAEGDVQTIAVAERARRHGLGRTLVISLVNEARRRGAREIFLEVRVDNVPAKHLYRELGFEVLGVRPGYYQPENVDAEVMRLTVPDPVTAPAVGQE